eukprot:3522617-Prymnesium_polylepis.2
MPLSRARVQCLTKVPPTVKRKYFDRGWCHLEFYLAAALKQSRMGFLDIGRMNVDVDELKSFYRQVIDVCSAERKPVPTRERFREELLKKQFTNGKEDHPAVVELFEHFLDDGIANAEKL